MGRDTNALHDVELLTCEEIQSPGGSSLTPLWSGRLSSLGILEPLADISGPELSPSLAEPQTVTQVCLRGLHPCQKPGLVSPYPWNESLTSQ